MEGSIENVFTLMTLNPKFLMWIRLRMDPSHPITKHSISFFEELIN